MTTPRHAHVDWRRADLKVGPYGVILLTVTLLTGIAISVRVVGADLSTSAKGYGGPAVALREGGQVGPTAQPVRHAMGGMVLTVDVARKSVVISHDAVSGVMPAMTMPFEVRDAKELAGLVPGTIVSFTLVLTKESGYIERVKAIRYQSVEQDPMAARRLRLLSNLTGSTPARLAVGQAVPDFTLLDQSRQRVSLSQFAGKVVGVNFIYTSCVLPQFCYRVANHFSVIRDRFKDRMGRDLVLLTVTFDPARDTPERLAQYASQWKADSKSWHFMTGNATDVERVCGMFGVDFFADEGLMSHSVRTAVIDRRGVLVANIEGNTYTASQLGDLVDTALKKK
jgi:protein SCO1/2